MNYSDTGVTNLLNDLMARRWGRKFRPIETWLRETEVLHIKGQKILQILQNDEKAPPIDNRWVKYMELLHKTVEAHMAAVKAAIDQRNILIGEVQEREADIEKILDILHAHPGKEGIAKIIEAINECVRHSSGGRR
jgi:hypothetical protein